MLDDKSKFLDLMSDEQKTGVKTSLKENQVRDKLAVHNISITDAENLSRMYIHNVKHWKDKECHR